MEDMSLQTQEEFHSFEVDANIVNDLIHSQNGTISTALRELVMNAFDANSKKVEILLWAEGFEVKDSGDGFEDEASIMRNFKRFGAPHTEGDAVYGRFRIGRGQVMAFAETTWHSKSYKMISQRQVEGRQAGFVFQKDVEPYDGCHVYGKFYKSLDMANVHGVIEDLTQLVRYSPWPVFINQVQVNAQDGVVWGYEDDKIKVQFNPKGSYEIKLYSLGILVKKLDMYRYGIAADVVTKGALRLNMARNEINEHDPLWLHVHKVLRAELQKRQSVKNKMSESARYAFIDQFYCEDMSFSEIAKLPLLKDARGKISSFDKELKKDRPWTVCEDDQIAIADRVSVQGNAFVILRSELDAWRSKSLESLIALAIKNMGIDPGRYYRSLLRKIEIVPFDKISAGVNGEYSLIKIADLSPLERAQRNALQYAANNMSKRLEGLHEESFGKRKVHIGVGHAVAWTDSITYIAFNKKTLALFGNGPQGITQLTAILLHEFIHRSGSVSNNGHDMDFYESFHDSVICDSVQHEILGNAGESLKSQYRTELETQNLPFPKWMANRDKIVVELTCQSNTPTPLLMWFLKLIAVPFIKGRGRIEIHTTGKLLWELREQISKKIDSAIEKNSLPLVKLSDFGYLSNYKEQKDRYAEEKYPIVKAMFEKERMVVSDVIVKALIDLSIFRFNSNCPFGGLSILVEDESFGVKCLQYDDRRNIKVMGGKGFIYTSNFCDGWRDRAMTAKDFAEGGKEGRFAHYHKILEQLVDGITSPEERKEFVERVFNDPMKKLLIS